MRPRSLSKMFALTFCAVSGCAAIAETNHIMMQAFKPKTGDYEMGKGGDEWSDVGVEARGDQKMERDPDRWYKDYVQSEKARSIEKNLGVE
ncbi:MAG: hypothetical protein WEB58_02455 [Planctomycetaceae bacterium]